MNTLEGTFTALVTPFTADGSAVDFDRLLAALARQLIAGVDGVVPCGTTGETPTLSAPEHEAVVERTVAAGKPMGLTVIAGAGSNDTARAVKLHRQARAAGADAALHVTPYYNRPSPEGLRRHFLTIADAADLPVVLYNIPGRAGVGLNPETIHALARHENIRAIKDATGDVVTAGAIAADTPLTVLSGDDPLTLPLLSVGARGVISVASNIVPHRVAALVEAFRAGDHGDALRLHRLLLPLARGLLTLDANPIPVKTALAILGLDTGSLRLPLCPPVESVVRTLRDLLAAHDLDPRQDRAAVATHVESRVTLTPDDRERLEAVIASAPRSPDLEPI